MQVNVTYPQIYGAYIGIIFQFTSVANLDISIYAFAYILLVQPFPRDGNCFATPTMLYTIIIIIMIIMIE